MRIAGIVVWYNPTKEDKKKIYSYLLSLDKLYIFDNSSKKNTYTKNSKIEYIFNGANVGIAKALNVGAQKAIKEGYKWLLTMDQDSNITEQIINQMKKFLLNTKIKKIGLVSPYQDIDSKEEILDKEYEDRIEVMTSGNIINLEVYQKINGFKDWLFIDCVDTDYCMNLHKHGYKVLRLNRIVMKHELGNLKVHRLFGKEYPCYNHNPIRRYYIVRNNFYINDMYGNLFPEYCKWLIRVQKGQVKRILAFEKNKFQKLKMMFKGYRDYKKNIKGKLVQ